MREIHGRRKIREYFGVDSAADYESLVMTSKFRAYFHVISLNAENCFRD